MRFRLKAGCGQHIQDGKVYRPGEVIETDKPLDKMFARTQKFERIIGSPNGNGADAVEAPPQFAEHGTDVTSIARPDLLGGPLRVFQKGPWFNVVDTATGQRLNDKSLKREQVDAFLAELIESSELEKVA